MASRRGPFVLQVDIDRVEIIAVVARREGVRVIDIALDLQALAVLSRDVPSGEQIGAGLRAVLTDELLGRRIVGIALQRKRTVLASPIEAKTQLGAVPCVSRLRPVGQLGVVSVEI